MADRNATYVTLDDPEQLADARDDPMGFLVQGSHGTLVIDEAQLVPEITRVLKLNVDRTAVRVGSCSRGRRTC